MYVLYVSRGIIQTHMHSAYHVHMYTPKCICLYVSVLYVYVCMFKIIHFRYIQIQSIHTHAYTYRQTTSFIEILNRGRHPALWKWRLTPCGLHARTHARSLTVTQVILILSPSCPPPTPSLLPPSLLFASCYSLYAYSQLPTLASHSEEIID